MKWKFVIQIILKIHLVKVQIYIKKFIAKMIASNNKKNQNRQENFRQKKVWRKKGKEK